ncbi:MAG: MBL fold metallo-hydrolase [Alphaproteobacteria bacterium]|nr:MBL fold metallo-hydrolase [Alphaproteobacteria bacterium]
MTQTPDVRAYFDEETFTVTYLVWDSVSKEAAIIDSVLGYDPVSGRSTTQPVEDIIRDIKEMNLKTKWILETHVHADHLSAAPHLKNELGGQIGIGSKIPVIQDTFAKIFNAEDGFQKDGSQFDILLDEDADISLGEITGHILHTPGHTPACMTIIFGDAAFVGDTLFMPDYGTARCDFPGGDASVLYKSIQKILALADETRIFTGHDYKAPGREEYAWESSVLEQKTKNVHIAGQDEDAFKKMRNERDAKLDLPRLIVPSVQVNMRAGNMPPKEENGVSYIKVPVNLL